MKSLLRAALAVLSVVILLTWLLLHSVGPPGEDYVLAQRDVARVAQGEAALQRDVLQARAGLLRDYDPLAEDIEDLRQFALELRTQARVRARDRGLLDAMLGIVARDEVALERFKTDNALLQNSLSQFESLDRRLAADALQPRLALAIAALGNALLQLTRDPSTMLQQVMRMRLEMVARLMDSTSDPAYRDAVGLLVTHARLLSCLLPGVDEDLRALFSISTYDLRQDVRRSQDARRTMEEAHAARFRLALYGMAIMLFAVLVRVGLQRRVDQRKLRDRAELEEVIVALSTRFISIPLDRYEEMFDQTLSRLGSAFGADRAYLMLIGSTPPARIWSRPGVDTPASWPGPVLQPALAASAEDDLVAVSDVGALPATKLRDVLVSAGNRGWCGVVLRVGEQRAGLLGFDLTQRATYWPRGGSGMARMAADVLQNALQRRQAALERLELQERLNRARRLEALGRFASGIAHNFNNMIGAVLGHAEMASDIMQPNTEPAHHVREIRRAGERAQELVTRIHDFGTRRKTRHQVLSVDALLEEADSVLRVLLPGNVALAIESTAPGCFIRGDTVQIQQVLLNVIRNAAQAMEGGGQVMLQVIAETVLASRKLSHDTLPVGKTIRFRVSDTGTGMDALTLANLFQPFFTTRPAGTGLGLASVREIVRDHDGAIDVRSIPQQGTTFTIWLPAVDAAAALRSGDQRGTGQTVMLLGAEPDVILRDEEMLAALGYEPVGFRSPEAALAACRKAPDRFDAILIDLPRLDVVSSKILRELHDVVVRGPILLVTGEPVRLTGAELEAMGIWSVLARPLCSSILAATFAECCGVTV